MEEANSIASAVKLRQRACVTVKEAGGAGCPDVAGVSSSDEAGPTPDQPDQPAGAVKKVVSVWSPEEKSVFFDALKLYGKNFIEISRHMKVKVRLTGGAPPRTRNQVKVFYQRTWNSIRHFLTFDEAVRPAVRELYGLINYGHFRKYLVNKKLNARLGEKLNELVHNGTTRLKVRGKKKTFIVRSPVCPALRRLNCIQGPRPEYQFPEVLLIDLVPRTGLSFARVQAAGQNPRVRAKVSANRQLYDLLEAVQAKWRTAAVRLRESLGLPAQSSACPRFTVYLPGAGEDSEENEAKEREEGATCITSVSKSTVKDIALQTYLAKQEKEEQQDQQQQQQQEEERPTREDRANQLKLDLSRMLETLRRGVTVEESREIRLLALYLASGCPSVLRLEYEYLARTDLSKREAGITNTLRRLFHLAVHELRQLDERTALETENATLKAKVDSLQAQTVALRDQVRELHKTHRQSGGRAAAECHRCATANQETALQQHQQQHQQVQFQTPQPCSTSRLQLKQISLLAGKKSLSVVQRQLRMGGEQQQQHQHQPQQVQHLQHHLQMQQQQQQQQQQQLGHSSLTLTTTAPVAPHDDSLAGLLDELTPVGRIADGDNATSFVAVGADLGSSTPRPNNWESAYSSPLKTPQRLCDNSRDSFTLTSAINAMMNEDTAEYVDKFAQLMQEINSDNGDRK